jgi:hypothetical protein
LDVDVEFELDGGQDSDVLLTGTRESYIQHYGFATIALNGLELNTRAPAK